MEPSRRDGVLVRIQVLERQAHALHAAFQTDSLRGEVRKVLETLDEAATWLRGAPSEEVVGVIAETVQGAADRLYSLVRDRD